MARAVFNSTVIAESGDTILVEGNHYFPPDAIRREHLEESDQRSVCPWKGTASYYDVVVDGARAAGAAWYYPQPKRKAKQLRDHVAFWGDVTVEA